MARKAKATTPALTENQLLNEVDMTSLLAAEPELMAEILEETIEAAAEDETLQVEADPVEDEQLSLSDLIESVTADEKAEMLAQINEAFHDRAAFEADHNPGNGNIQKTLKGYHTKMALPGIAAMLLATETDPGFINRSISEGKRFNVYAIDKANDLLHGLNGRDFKNAINMAVMRSMFRFRAAGAPFTGLAAIAAASDKVKVDKVMQALLTRHTVSAATAPTQSSSTMNALVVIGAVRNKGTAKFPIWELTDAPVTKALEKRFG